jgi:polyisoprenoid-binding protein YceI
MQNKKYSAVAGFVVMAALLGLSSVASADTYGIDNAHSSAYFRIKHLGVGYVQGLFTSVSGTIVDGESVDISIDTASVYTAVKKRDDHLRSADFFNAKQNPTMTFKSTSMKKVSGDKYKVTGKLTIKGKTKVITLDVERTGAGKDPWGGQRVGYWAEFTVNRNDFGVDFMPDGLSDDVQIRIGVEGVKK